MVAGGIKGFFIGFSFVFFTKTSKGDKYIDKEKYLFG